MIRVGCCGWPVGRPEYFRRLGAVEVNSSFYNLPQLSTARRWRQEAPAGFEYALKAWQLVTHPCSSRTYGRLRLKLPERFLARCGHFREGPEVQDAWERTAAVAEALGARLVLFQTPASFHPGADHLRDMYRFFKRLRRSGFLLAWEPRAESWEGRLVERVCGDLGLLWGGDPLSRPLPAPGRAGYFRLHGRVEGRRIRSEHDFTDDELRRLLSACAERDARVYFNNASMWRDAGRFEELLRFGAPLPRRGHVRALRPL